MLFTFYIVLKIYAPGLISYDHCGQLCYTGQINVDFLLL